jgi:cytoskeletal protein CcmA (bactofilin family)
MKAISVEPNKEGSALFRRLFPRREDTEPPHTVPADPCVATAPSNGTFMPKQSGSFLSQGVSIKGSVKFLNGMFVDGKVTGAIDSTGTLTIGEHARIRGDIRTKSVNVRGTVEGNVFATERCELEANCTLRGDIEATRLVVNENATFRGHAKVGTRKSTPGLTFASRAKRQSTTQSLAADHATL